MMIRLSRISRRTGDPAVTFRAQIGGIYSSV